VAETTKSYAEHVQELAAKLVHDRFDLGRSAAYYEATVRLEAIGIAVPEKMRVLSANIGWPRLYLDSIEERLDLESFRLADDSESVEELMEWWKANDLDEESGMAHLDAMIYGRSYITVSAPGELDEDQDTPIIRVESPLHMYAETDPRTRKVTRALRLYTNPDNEGEQWATLYLPNETVSLVQRGGHWIVDNDVPPVVHGLGEVPVIPLLNRERLSDRDGRSEITPEIRSFTDAAARIMMDMQAAAELMAVPQRVLFGVDAGSLAPNGSPTEVLNAYLAQILAVENEQGKAHQFQAAELMNFVNVLDELSKHVAAYTGLPPQYLSFSSENPASAEAIKSSESRLVKKCERKARMYGGGWERVMRLAKRVMGQELGPEWSRLESVWRDPATPTYAALADGVTKLYANGVGIITKRRAREDMGYSDEEIAQMEEQEKAEQAELKRLSDILTPKPPAGPTGPNGSGTRTSTSTSSTTTSSQRRGAA
jgi:hypothetical protein